MRIHSLDSACDPSDGDTRSLAFWVIGDLHFRARKQWQELHERRMSAFYSDLSAIWQAEGSPAFVVSPGDIVHSDAPENYAFRVGGKRMIVRARDHQTRRWLAQWEVPLRQSAQSYS